MVFKLSHVISISVLLLHLLCNSPFSNAWDQSPPECPYPCLPPPTSVTNCPPPPPSSPTEPSGYPPPPPSMPGYGYPPPPPSPNFPFYPPPYVNYPAPPPPNPILPYFPWYYLSPQVSSSPPSPARLQLSRVLVSASFCLVFLFVA